MRKVCPPARESRGTVRTRHANSLLQVSNFLFDKLCQFEIGWHGNFCVVDQHENMVGLSVCLSGTKDFLYCKEHQYRIGKKAGTPPCFHVDQQHNFSQGGLFLWAVIKFI